MSTEDRPLSFARRPGIAPGLFPTGMAKGSSTASPRTNGLLTDQPRLGLVKPQVTGLAILSDAAFTATNFLVRLIGHDNFFTREHP
ncbi:hypothetical protein [Actinoplanes derwentensis]|uniref:hypothetical protein n=1 Tax=Actinoplanes derwentensis TaxID=113562 RepID=UPI0012FD903C|nr:hypothetical protein [Actinoplanes derwentensis]